MTVVTHKNTIAPKLALIDASSSIGVSFLEKYTDDYRITAMTTRVSPAPEVALADTAETMAVHDTIAFARCIEACDYLALIYDEFYNGAQYESLDNLLYQLEEIMLSCQFSRLKKIVVVTPDWAQKNLNHLTHRLEAILRRMSVKYGCDSIILNTGPIFGRRAPGFELDLMRLTSLFALVTNILPKQFYSESVAFVNVDDVAEAIHFCLQYPHHMEGNYALNGESRMATNQHFNAIVDALGLRATEHPFVALLRSSLDFLAKRHHPSSLYLTDELFEYLWQKVSFQYDLAHDAPPFFFHNLTKAALGPATGNPLSDLGFKSLKIRHLMDAQSALSHYRKLRWVPNLDSPPLRYRGLRLNYQQRWEGYVVQTSQPNIDLPIQIDLILDAPVLPSPLKAVATVTGRLCIKDFVKDVPVSGNKYIYAFANLLGFSHTHLKCRLKNLDYEIALAADGEHGPHYKIEIKDEHDRIAFKGKISQSWHPKALLKRFKQAQLRFSKLHRY